MLEHAFEHVGAMRVEFKTDARNVESRRALEALPATFEGILRRHMLIHAGIRDSAYYAITDDDWARGEDDPRPPPPGPPLASAQMSSGDFVHEERVRFRDLDPMGHVNNAVFLTYLEQARVAFFSEM